MLPHYIVYAASMAKLYPRIKKTILQLSFSGLSSQQMATSLRRKYAVIVSRQAINRFIRYYERSHSLMRKPGSGRPSKLSPTVYQIVEAKMQSDDETTATQLRHVLNLSGFNISLATIKRCRRELG